MTDSDREFVEGLGFRQSKTDPLLWSKALPGGFYAGIVAQLRFSTTRQRWMLDYALKAPKAGRGNLFNHEGMDVVPLLVYAQIEGLLDHE